MLLKGRFQEEQTLSIQYGISRYSLLNDDEYIQELGQGAKRMKEIVVMIADETDRQNRILNDMVSQECCV